MINEKGEEVGIIYGWCNIKNEKWYIGQTVNPEGRFKNHINDAINKKDNTYFHRALRKYRLDNWVYCVLEDNILRENLNMKEQEWIEYYDSFNSGYNMTVGGGQTIFSEEVKEKISNSIKGNHLSEETKKKLSESCKGITPWNKGKHLSEETKLKMSVSRKGKKLPQNRKKVSQYDLNGNYIQTFNSLKEAQEKTNIAKSSICTVCRGIRKQAGGFIWKYA